MARVKNNIFLKEVSGTISKQINVFNRYGETYVRAAKKSKPGIHSAAQLQTQHNFQDAVVYAREVIKDEDMAMYYQAFASGGRSAYHMAMKDAMIAPSINWIDIDDYDGQAGSRMIIRALDFFRVYQVLVEIIDMTGKVLESGDAIQQWKPMDWCYTATTTTDKALIEMIRVTARDMPGNKTTMATVINTLS